MKLVVIIATVNRKALVSRILAHLENQIRLPDEVIVSAPDDSHVEAYQSSLFEIRRVFGKTGLCAQRNLALEHAIGRFDIITFFDDDFLAANDYLQNVTEAFRQNPDWAVVTNHSVCDGITGAGFTFQDGLEKLRSDERCRSANLAAEPQISDHVGAYGCNMSMRTNLIGDLRFDERLVLYGWQEDTDFTGQLRKHGHIIGLDSLNGVHLGTKTGRVSGMRFGYSQIANPVYLIRKGTMPMSFALRLISRNLLSNFIKSFWSEPYVDRWGRLKGNLLAASHIIRGRIEPEYILKL